MKSSLDRINRRFLSMLALLLYCGTASAIFVRDDLAPIGTPGVGLDDYNALAALYPTVGYLWNGATNGEWCTATLVKGNASFVRVITAAHCVFDFDTDAAKATASANAKEISAAEAANLTFSMGSVLGNLLGPGLAITQGWYQGNYVGGVSKWDVAILEVGTSLASLGDKVSHVSLANPADWLGKQADFVGWGRQGAGAANPNLSVVANGLNPDNLKYTDGSGSYFASDRLAAQNIIDLNPSNSASDMIVTDFDRVLGGGANPLGNQFGLNFEGTTAPGDSGGPIFPNAIDGLVGVLSGGFSDVRGCRTDSLYDDCSAWASLYVNRDFVDQYLAHVPVPGSLWLLLPGLAGLFARRRGRAS